MTKVHRLASSPWEKKSWAKEIVSWEFKPENPRGKKGVNNRSSS